MVTLVTLPAALAAARFLRRSFLISDESRLHVDDHERTLDDYLAILKRRKWQLILPALLLSMVAVLAALLLPPLYRSSATILIEQQEIPD